MATCPRCLGPLVEGHRCPPRLWRRVTRVLPAIAVGGVVGIAACLVVEEHAGAVLVTIAGSLGSVVGLAATRALGGSV